ncbi:hypothetical protein C5167_018360 [Papaver somniferum]|uniref:Uncharacterized protein n=1 Tax=Papaver somniferum TaxID=3469 RepID=A0A4Y7IM28_PAPSO|nr:hypothetical protein C5167_018360 [Papaver somniferum]
MIIQNNFSFLPLINSLSSLFLVFLSRALIYQEKGDIISGTSASGTHHSGWFGVHWWNGRFFVLLFTTLGVFSPLAFIKQAGSNLFALACLSEPLLEVQDSVSNRLGLQSILVQILTRDMGTGAVREVGLPSGVLNIVTELSPEADARLTSYPHVDKKKKHGKETLRMFKKPGDVTFSSYYVAYKLKARYFRPYLEKEFEELNFQRRDAQHASISSKNAAEQQILFSYSCIDINM